MSFSKNNKPSKFNFWHSIKGNFSKFRSKVEQTSMFKAVMTGSEVFQVISQLTTIHLVALYAINSNNSKYDKDLDHALFYSALILALVLQSSLSYVSHQWANKLEKEKHGQQLTDYRLQFDPLYNNIVLLEGRLDSMIKCGIILNNKNYEEIAESWINESYEQLKTFVNSFVEIVEYNNIQENLQGNYSYTDYSLGFCNQLLRSLVCASTASCLTYLFRQVISANDESRKNSIINADIYLIGDYISVVGTGLLTLRGTMSTAGVSGKRINDLLYQQQNLFIKIDNDSTKLREHLENIIQCLETLNLFEKADSFKKLSGCLTLNANHQTRFENHSESGTRAEEILMKMAISTEPSHDIEETKNDRGNVFRSYQNS